ncbi:M48 family metalloprotease [Candidatus Dependentiae bacterium]|nr:M48 family metalloprotease [Candidatus Dependentiae bacterium]
MKKILIILFSIVGSIQASFSYQEMLADAKTKLGISIDIPLVESCDIDCNKYAEAGRNQIRVYKRLLDNEPYGVKRFTIFHEASHIKHNDYIVKNLLKVSIALGLPFLMYPLLNNENNSLFPKLASAFLGLTTAALLDPKIIQSMERRADTEASFGVACETCLQECSDHLKECHETYEREKQWTDKGYLSSDEILRIQKQFKGQQCSYHKNQTPIVTK